MVANKISNRDATQAFNMQELSKANEREFLRMGGRFIKLGVCVFTFCLPWFLHPLA
jgi:hypothetical protein